MSKEIFKLEGTIEINNTSANESIDETTEKAQGLADAIEGTGKSADKTGKTMGSSGKFGAGSVFMGYALSKLAEKAVSLGKVIGKTGFNFNASMESYQNQFTSLLGDADKAAKLVSDLQTLAKISPLGMEGLAKNAVSLLSTGFELADIIPTLQSLGDLSLGDQNKLDSAVRAYSQIVTKGQMMAQEMYQLSDAGIPIIEIMTKYGGDRYADGSWYMQKLTDKDYMIPAEDMVKAFAAATAEGAKWHDYMYNMMDTWSGQTDRLGEEGKESVGAFMKPFFDMAKSEVLPKMADSLALFGTWATENKDTIEKIADTVGKFATITFDGALDFFKWLTENGEAVATAIGVIGTAMGIAAATAHPYAAAVSAIAGALMYLNSEAGKKRGTFDHMFDGYTESDIETLNRYVDALNAMREAQDVSLDTYDFDKQLQAEALYDAALAEVNAIDGLLATYNTWHSAQAGYAGANGPALKVGLQIAEDAESVMQGDIDGMNFSATVKMYADTSSLNTTYSYAPSVDGSHAGGLDFVPRDNYIARLHKGEQVLTRSQADAYRNGMGSQDIGRLETAINQLAVMMQQVANNTRGGQMVVLDSGAVVGQLAPMMDAQLGAISGRKGRRN